MTFYVLSATAKKKTATTQRWFASASSKQKMSQPGIFAHRMAFKSNKMQSVVFGGNRKNTIASSAIQMWLNALFRMELLIRPVSSLQYTSSSHANTHTIPIQSRTIPVNIAAQIKATANICHFSASESEKALADKRFSDLNVALKPYRRFAVIFHSKLNAKPNKSP